jgi:hypothetical protein
VSKPRSLITSTAALARSMSIEAKVSGEPWMDVKLAERLGGEAAPTGDKMLRRRAGSLLLSTVSHKTATLLVLVQMSVSYSYIWCNVLQMVTMFTNMVIATHIKTRKISKSFF